MSQHQVFLSPVAEFKLDRLLNFLINEWGEKAKINFLEDFRKAVSKIEQFPKSNPMIEQHGGLYKCVVSKQTSFFYRIQGLEIEILTISDNRQNPKNILDELKKFR